MNQKLKPHSSRRILTGWNLIFLCILVIQVILWFYTNIHCQYINDHDAAKVQYHTMQIWEQKAFVLPDWKYMTTGEWDCASLLALPFYGLTGDIVLSFAISDILNMLLFVAVLFALMRFAGVPVGTASIAISFLLIPFCSGAVMYVNVLFFSAAQYIYKVLIPLWFLELLFIPGQKRFAWYHIAQTAAFLLLYFINVFSSGLYVFVCGLFPILVLDAFLHFHASQKDRFRGIGLPFLVLAVTAIGFMAQKHFGITTTADAMVLTRLTEFFPALNRNFISLLEVMEVLPVTEVYVLSPNGIIYVAKVTMFLLILGIGIPPLSKLFRLGPFASVSDIHTLRTANLPLFCSLIFCWNFFILQLSTSTARYHLIGFIPLVLAAFISFFSWLQKQSVREKHLYSLAVLLITLFLMGSCWYSTFRGIGNYFYDYYSALEDIAAENEVTSVAFINDSASAEIARVYDPRRTYVSYFVSNHSLINYDAYRIMDDRSSLDSRHLLVESSMGSLSEMPDFLRGSYRQVGDIYGDPVYLSDFCGLDGMSGPVNGYVTIDLPYSPGYIYDTALRDNCIFPAGDARCVLTSPEFNAGNGTRVSITYLTSAEKPQNGGCARICLTVKGESRVIELPGDRQTVQFDIEPDSTFSFTLDLDSNVQLSLSEIRYETP